MGALAAIASLVTLRFYIHVAPLWVILTGSGAGAIALALGVRRWLDSSPAKERGGFTAEHLFEESRRKRLLETAAILSSFTPAARELHDSSGGGGFDGGGGESGGAGATGEF